MNLEPKNPEPGTRNPDLDERPADGGIRANPEHAFEQLSQELWALAEKIEQLVAIDSQCGAAPQDLGRLSERPAGQHGEGSDAVARSSRGVAPIGVGSVRGIPVKERSGTARVAFEVR